MVVCVREESGMPTVAVVTCNLIMQCRVNHTLLPPTNEVWGKVIFYTCLSVILFKEVGSHP